jgi:hypothetical protein
MAGVPLSLFGFHAQDESTPVHRETSRAREVLP